MRSLSRDSRARVGVAVVLALFIVLIYLIGLSFVLASSGDIVYRGNSRSGAYADLPVRSAPHVVWEYQLPKNSLFTAPVVSGGTLFVTAQDGILRALDRDTVQQLWTFTPGGGASISATPLISGDLLFVPTDGALYALEAGTGSQRWSFSVGSTIFGSPAFDSGILYLAEQKGTVYAIDAGSGAEKWRFEGSGNTIHPLALSDGIVFAPIGTNLHALDATSGHEVWHLDAGSDASWYGPAVADNVVYAPNDNDYLYALNARTGEQVWRVAQGEGPTSPPAVVDGIVYSGDRGNHIRAFDVSTGAQLWEFDTDDWPSNPSVVSGVLFVNTANHEEREGPRNLYALDARTGAELWRFQADSRLFAPPAFADHILYLQSWFGKVYALSDTIPPLASPTAGVVPTPTTPIATVTLPGNSSRTFSETGKTVNGIFLDYWDANGGLAQQGYPISDLIGETSELDGKGYTVQYFERAVFEYHPENQAPYNVLLSQLGTFRYKSKYPDGALNQKPNTSEGSRLFAETGHRVGGKFPDYWESHGGLVQQGFPISDEFDETSELDGKVYTVQYFERAVFELHPENAGTQYEVLLSQLGTFQYQAKYGSKNR